MFAMPDVVKPDMKPDMKPGVKPDMKHSVPTYGFAIHTASPNLGLAIQRVDALPEPREPSRCQTWSIGREVSNYLHLYLSEFIQPHRWQDLAFLAVAKGPGGFTGTRLGVVTARTLAEQLDRPLFAVSTLAAVVWQVWQSSQAKTPETIAVTLPAHRSEVYGAIYQATDHGLRVQLPDAVMPLAQWQQLLQQQSFDRLIQTDQDLGQELGFTATALLELANLGWQQGDRPHWSDALPFYGQSPVT